MNVVFAPINVTIALLSLLSIGVFGRLHFHGKHAASQPSKNEEQASFRVQPKTTATGSFTTSLGEAVEKLPPYIGQQGLCNGWLPDSACHSRPMYPDHVRHFDFVSSVTRVPCEEEKQFKEQYFNHTKASFRKNPLPLQEQNIIMASRFDWACKNIETLTNMMRISGIQDEAIRDMFDGLPLCWPNRDLFNSFRQDLSDMAKVLETAVGFSDMHFVHMGSSVIGFSQNPYKGSHYVPSWISNPLKSDVDILIIAHGVRDFVSQNKEKIVELDNKYGDEPVKLFSIKEVRVELKNEHDYYYDYHYNHCTGSDKNASCTSYIRLYESLGDEFGAFWKKWENRLGKPIQFLIAEPSEHSVLPEWCIVLDQPTQASNGAQLALM